MTINELIAELERERRVAPGAGSERVFVTRNGQALPPGIADGQTLTVSYTNEDEPAGVWIDTIEGE